MSKTPLPSLPDLNSFAAELIKARAEQGFTQAQLATASGVSVSAVKAYEAGRNMPGARELRELCQALGISPNKLLFGTETPFEQQSFADLLADGEKEDDHVARARATILLGLLSADERRALLTLAKSLAIARHGIDKVREAMTAADLLAGMGRMFGQLTKEGLKNGEIDKQMIDASAHRLEEFMERQGHKPASDGLPKK